MKKVAGLFHDGFEEVEAWYNGYLTATGRRH